MSKDVNNGQSRREFLGRSVAALAAASFPSECFLLYGEECGGSRSG
ncbi:hypothetical protein M5E82_16825 [Parabacteroides distasonis]|nr:hypothetical protein M5E82_16825 [Parabacteroides distasonis]